MKFGLLLVVLVIASCAPSRPLPPTTVPERPATIPDYPSSPPVPAPPSTSSAPPEPMPGRVTNPAKPASNYSQDAVDCERKAALSQVGGRGEAFAACMRSRGYSAGR